MIIINNNDQTLFTIPNNGVLSLLINTDLDYKQSLDLLIQGNIIGSENKMLNIYINYSVNSAAPIVTPLITGINLPVFYNKFTKSTNSADNWSKFNFNIDINSPIQLNTGSILQVPIDANYNLIFNSINTGDTLNLNNFSIGTSSTIDFSGQYTVNSVGATNSYIYLDVSTNPTLVAYGASSSLPLIFNNNANYLLNNNPYFDLNKGFKYRITRIDQTDSSAIEDRYLIEKEVM